MQRDKIQRWLKLGDGPWPPDFYTLIGLKPGEGDAAGIEARILERLELLRRYQLAHPDEATEGMSLLARALDCLTSPEARRAYDKGLGLKPAKEEVRLLSVDELISATYADVPVLTPDTEDSDEAAGLPMGILLPDIEDELELDLEVDDDLDLVDEEPELPEVIEPPPLPRKKTKIPTALPEAILLPDDPRPAKWVWKNQSNRPQSAKRERYANAVRVRRVLRVFDEAHRYFTNHEQGFSRHQDTVGLIACLADMRPLLPTVADLIGGVGEPGNLLATMTRQRLMIDTFANLLPGQKERLANDFRAAHYRLENEYRGLRQEIDRRKEKTPWREYGVPVVRFYAKYPELGLIPLGLTALMVAILRG